MILDWPQMAAGGRGMTRYFYSDPLAAAWMAKHFGMVFNRWGDGVSEWQGSLCEADSLQEFDPCSHFVIHPDSMHLLEPQVGDVLQSTKGVMGGVSVGYLKSMRWLENETLWTILPRFGDGNHLDAHWGNPKEWQRIIQRDGKPFHWPECES